jgi:Gpi18-like mannosyltransferase
VNETRTARTAFTRRDLLVLGGLLLLGLAVRLAVMPATGFPSDVAEVQGWALRLREGGLPMFYEDGQRSVYPAVLFLLWPLSVLPDEILRVAVKGLSIPFDLIIGALLFWMVSARASVRYGSLAAGLYLFNPGIILAGPFWGQWDAIGTALFLGALIAAASGRMPAAGALAALATLAKPQFGLVGLVVLGLAVASAWRARDVMPILRASAGALVAAAVILVPLRLSLLDWLGQVNALDGVWPYT